MKIKKYKGYFIVITITSIILLVYLIYYQADMKSLISFNNKRDIDRFVKQLMHENIYEKSFFCVCEYNIQNMFIYSLFLITKNYVYALNIYYILSFFVISVTTFWMLQKFECSVWSSVFGAVLLCFLPYHIERGQGQIVDSTFFMVPLLVGSVYEYLRCEKKEKVDKLLAISVILPWINIKLAYGFMFIYLLIILCMHESINVRKNMLCEFTLVINCIVATLIKNFHYLNVGSDRLQVASEEGMRILDFFVPVRYHVLDRLLNFRLEYDISLAATRESGENSMGFLLAFFLFYTFFSFFIKKSGDQRVSWFAWINIFIILIANTDGFGYVFEYLGANVGYWNRLSIFIIVNTIVVMAISMDKIYIWFRERRIKIIGSVLVGAVQILAFMDIFLRHEFYFN